MERQTAFNIWYLMLALLAVIWMRDAWVGASRVAPGGGPAPMGAG